jgi:predicted transcriptional regulator
LRISIDHRRARQAFIARGLALREEAKRTGEYFTADEVSLELDEMLVRTKPRSGK